MSSSWYRNDISLNCNDLGNVTDRTSLCRRATYHKMTLVYVVESCLAAILQASLSKHCWDSSTRWVSVRKSWLASSSFHTVPVVASMSLRRRDVVFSLLCGVANTGTGNSRRRGRSSGRSRGMRSRGARGSKSKGRSRRGMRGIRMNGNRAESVRSLNSFTALKRKKNFMAILRKISGIFARSRRMTLNIPRAFSFARTILTMARTPSLEYSSFSCVWAG